MLQFALIMLFLGITPLSLKFGCMQFAVRYECLARGDVVVG